MFFYHIFVNSQSTLVQQHQFFEYLHSVQHGFVVLPSTTTHVALSRNLGPPRMDWLGGSFRCYVIVHGNGRPLRPFCTIPSFVNVWIRSSPPPLIFTFVKKAEKHRHSQITGYVGVRFFQAGWTRQKKLCSFLSSQASPKGALCNAI